MDRWTDRAYPMLIRIANQDTDYRNLQRICAGQEVEYIKILTKLSEEDRLMIDDYVASCEEMLFRFAQLAYQLGLVEGGVLEDPDNPISTFSTSRA